MSDSRRTRRLTRKSLSESNEQKVTPPCLLLLPKTVLTVLAPLAFHRHSHNKPGKSAPTKEPDMAAEIAKFGHLMVSSPDGKDKDSHAHDEKSASNCSEVRKDGEKVPSAPSEAPGRRSSVAHSALFDLPYPFKAVRNHVLDRLYSSQGQPMSRLRLLALLEPFQTGSPQDHALLDPPERYLVRQCLGRYQEPSIWSNRRRDWVLWVRAQGYQDCRLHQYHLRVD